MLSGISVFCFIVAIIIFIIAKGDKKLVGVLLMVFSLGFYLIAKVEPVSLRVKKECGRFEGSDIKAYVVGTSCYVEVEPGIYQNALSRNVELRPESWVKEHKN